MLSTTEFEFNTEVCRQLFYGVTWHDGFLDTQWVMGALSSTGCSAREDSATPTPPRQSTG
jgi:hypothetical protein